MFPSVIPDSHSTAEGTSPRSLPTGTTSPAWTPVSRTATFRRRRRHSIPDPSDSLATGGDFEGEGAGSEIASDEQDTILQHNQVGRNSPPTKRRRLEDMRPESGISMNMNGDSQASNGFPRSPSRKTPLSHSLNGSFNGDTQMNGPLEPPGSMPRFFDHDREEVTRILIQGLYDLGYDAAASTLTRESGYQLESQAVAAFRNAVIDGQWAEAENILRFAYHSDGRERPTDDDDDGSANEERLLLAENADKNEMLFYLRQQKFLELLEARDLGAALMVLRGELTPLNYDIVRLHALSRYVSIC